MGACLRLPTIQLPDWSETTANVLSREFDILSTEKEFVLYVTTASSISKKDGIEPISYDKADYTVPFMLVIGSEAHGISPEVCLVLLL